LDEVKALVVDDVADLRELLVTILEEWGIQCSQAGNGREALDALKTKGPFDFCTVDIFMPVMDGFGFVEAARKDPANAGLKILMVSTDIEKASIDKALKLGADEYLMKPYTRDMVESKLQLLRLIP
jgi:two-component system, chemotaxis family, chemotaxis protein CheY